MALFEPLFATLNRAGVRYVVVGGVAVVLHGHARLTADVDLVVDLEPGAARLAVQTLVQTGLVPRAPIDPAGFADPATRNAWVSDKGMKVFSWWDPRDPLREVDVFVEHAIPFADLWARSVVVTLETTVVRIAGIDDLIALKRAAGRPEDRADVEALEEIARAKGAPRG